MNCSPRLSELSGQREVILSQIQHGISNLMVTLQSCRNDDAEYSDLRTTLDDMVGSNSNSKAMVLDFLHTRYRFV